jgi:hypothetical protein
MRANITRAIAIAGIGLGLAIGAATPASAEKIWDIEAYDNCMGRIPTIPNDYEWYHWECCTKSGGEYDFNEHKCVAPPAEADNVPGNPTATGRPRPPLMPGGPVGVSDDPIAGTPLPTPDPRPRPDAPPPGGVG